MDVFAMIVACVLVLGLSAFILITLYTIVRDLLRKKNHKNKQVDSKNDLGKEDIK